jgi:hypothetical protein
VFHLLGDKLIFTTAAERTIDPTRGMNTKPYKIPEIYRMRFTNKQDMLRDGIILPSNRPWNSPILVALRKKMLRARRNGGLL